MLKKVFLVTVVTVLLGIIIVLASNLFSDQKLIKPKINPFDISTPTPIPTPTLPPINENSNLNGEIKNLTPHDFSKEFEQLRNSNQ